MHRRDFAAVIYGCTLFALLMTGCAGPDGRSSGPMQVEDSQEPAADLARDAVILNESFVDRQVLPVDNGWNLDMSLAPVDPQSEAFINFIGAGDQMRAGFGPSAYGIGIPYVGVGGNQALVPVDFVLYPEESDPGAPGRPPGYPIPPEAYLLPGYIEGGVAGGGGSGDRRLVVVDRDNWLLFETFGTHWDSGVGRWSADIGAVFNLAANTHRPDGWASTCVSGLAVFPGLVKYDEFELTQPIRHAFGVMLSQADGHIWPASSSATAVEGALPLGARLRLKAGVDVSGYSPQMQRVLQAMKTYGLIFYDLGSDMFVSGTLDERWIPDEYALAFRSLVAADFEVIRLGWNPLLTAVP